MASTPLIKGPPYYENLLRQKPEKFMALLDRNIIDGGPDGEAAKMQLDVLSSGDPKQASKMLLRYRNEDGDTVAHTAATFHRKPTFLVRCFDLSPDLLLEQRSDDFDGQTPLHIVVAKGNRKMARAILDHPLCVENHRCGAVLRTKAVGRKFKNTVMMGQLPLSVAALTFDPKMVKLLLKRGADVSWKNADHKDTVLHSLVRFASVHSDKTAQVLEMLIFLNSQLQLPTASSSPHHGKDLWHKAENRDRLTPLKLAASLGEVEIFTAILNLDGVYRSLNAHDGLFDIHLYDVTEIDTVTQAEWERHEEITRHSAVIKSEKRDDSDSSSKRGCLPFKSEKREDSSSSSRGCLPFPFRRNEKKKTWHDKEHRPALRHKAPAVLDIICQLPVGQAFDFIYVDAVRDLIDRKWDRYKWLFKLWSLYHLLMMIHVTAFTVYKTKVLNADLYPNRPVGLAEERFAYATAGFMLVYASIYIALELVRSFYFKQRWFLRLIQHKGTYRLMLIAFSATLLVDALWFLARPHNNYFLILALIFGWTFTTFFLRPWRRFSFYTVMFQKILLGDMTRLSVIIAFQLTAFSFAVYTTFLNTDPVPEGFEEDAGQAVLTMFKLMLGLTDIEVLREAREPWLATALYVGFVLVTYVLLVNSLIAMMSRTCDLVSEDRHRQWELQRLSVLLLVETMLLPRWRYLHKAGVKAVRRYSGAGGGLSGPQGWGQWDHHHQEFRCYVEITSVQNAYRDGKSVLRRKAMIDTLGGFGLGHHDQGTGGGGAANTSVWSPFFGFGSMRASHVGGGGGGFYDPLGTMPHGGAGMQQQTIIEEEESTDEEEEEEGNGFETINAFPEIDEDETEVEDDDEQNEIKSKFFRKSSTPSSQHFNPQSMAKHINRRYPATLERTLSGPLHKQSYLLPMNENERQRYQQMLLQNVLLRQRVNRLVKARDKAKSKHNKEQSKTTDRTAMNDRKSKSADVSFDRDSTDMNRQEQQVKNADAETASENPPEILKDPAKNVIGSHDTAVYLNLQRATSVQTSSHQWENIYHNENTSSPLQWTECRANHEIHHPQEGVPVTKQHPFADNSQMLQQPQPCRKVLTPIKVDTPVLQADKIIVMAGHTDAPSSSLQDKPRRQTPPNPGHKRLSVVPAVNTVNNASSSGTTDKEPIINVVGRNQQGFQNREDDQKLVLTSGGPKIQEMDLAIWHSHV